MTDGAAPATRLARLRAKMAGDGVDLVALGPGAHMVWLLGFHPHADERPCMLLVGAGGEAFLMPELNAEDARARTGIALCAWSDAQGPAAAMREALAKAAPGGVRSVAVDETMRTDFSLLLLDEIPQAARSYAAATVGELRMRKDEHETKKLQENASIADEAMRRCLAELGPGKTEQQVAKAARDAFAAQGAMPLFAIVAAGANGAYPHHQTGTSAFKEGDAIVIDIGGRKGMFSSDITRMAVLGEPSAKYREVHGVVEDAVVAALAAARPGAMAKEVDAAARKVIDDAGYGKHFVHRTGHGLGIEVHEPPFLTSTSETVLDSGMVFSIEPGIYLPGEFGVRLEEIVVLGQDGPRILSGLPRDAEIARL